MDNVRQAENSPSPQAPPLERVRRWLELVEFSIDNPPDRVDVLCDLAGELEDALEEMVAAGRAA